MNMQQAIKKIRQTTPISHYKVTPPKEWERREKLISVVEDMRQSPSYIRERNKLISKAEAFANATVTLMPDSDGYNQQEWNRIFLARMNVLMALERERAS